MRRDPVTLHATSCAPSLLQDAQEPGTVLWSFPVQPLQEAVDDPTAHARALGLQFEMLHKTPVPAAVVSHPYWPAHSREPCLDDDSQCQPWDVSEEV